MKDNPPALSSDVVLSSYLGTDSLRWAEQFCLQPRDQDTVLAWFANAIEAGRTAGVRDMLEARKEYEKSYKEAAVETAEALQNDNARLREALEWIEGWADLTSEPMLAEAVYVGGMVKIRNKARTALNTDKENGNG